MSAVIIKFPDRQPAKPRAPAAPPASSAYSEQLILDMLRDLAAKLGLPPLHSEKPTRRPRKPRKPK